MSRKASRYRFVDLVPGIRRPIASAFTSALRAKIMRAVAAWHDCVLLDQEFGQAGTRRLRPAQGMRTELRSAWLRQSRDKAPIEAGRPFDPDDISSQRRSAGCDERNFGLPPSRHQKHQEGRRNAKQSSISSVCVRAALNFPGPATAGPLDDLQKNLGVNLNDAAKQAAGALLGGQTSNNAADLSNPSSGQPQPPSSTTNARAVQPWQATTGSSSVMCVREQNRTPTDFQVLNTCPDRVEVILGSRGNAPASKPMLEAL